MNSKANKQLGIQRRILRRIPFLLFLVILVISCQKEISPPNVLFVAIDDLRPDLGCYGNTQIHSPNLDKIADQGFLFSHHYTNVPTCGPSRYCLLTGQRPISRAHLRNQIFETRDTAKQKTTRPESFIEVLRQNGYYTSGIGKISHSADGYIYGYEDKISTKRELPGSWNELSFDYGKWGTGWNAFFGYSNGENRQSLKKQVKPYENANVSDDGLVDGLTGNLARKKLRELKDRKQPFFLGVGFFKPHLPFTAPKKYWDMYNKDSIHTAFNPDIPENVNVLSLQNSGEFNQYLQGEEFAGLDHNVSIEYARKIRHAYFACISYIDHQVGLLMAELEELGLAKNTIVVVWGDHGWHLGEQRVWGKHTVFENALRSAFILKVPGMIKSKMIQQNIETVDIYPSLLELCGISNGEKVDGDSFVQLLKGTDSPESWDNNAYSYYRNGISLRTKRYRLTKYFRPDLPNIELYDHDSDPYESINIASENQAIIDSLLPILELGNTALYNSD